MVWFIWTEFQVVEEEDEEAVELPVNTDGTLELSTLTAQFPGATGLKYRWPKCELFQSQTYCLCPESFNWNIDS